MADSILAPDRFYVYVHSRLSTGEPFYVGKGNARRAFTIKSRSPHWKNIVAKDGGWYVSFIAERMDEDLAFLVEMEAIDKYRRLDVKLVNLTDGGDGPTGYRHTKPASNKGVPCSEEMKARISATLKAKGCLPPIGWNRGKKTPPDVIARRRVTTLATWARIKAAGGRTVSAETRAKMSAAKLGKKHTPEQNKAMSERMKSDPRVKARRLTVNMKGRSHTAESRAKMSASKKGRPSDKRKVVRCVETGKLFESATAAAKYFGRKEHTLIAACCKGAVKTAYGYTFEYANV